MVNARSRSTSSAGMRGNKVGGRKRSITQGGVAVLTNCTISKSWYNATLIGKHAEYTGLGCWGRKANLASEPSKPRTAHGAGFALAFAGLNVEG